MKFLLAVQRGSVWKVRHIKVGNKTEYELLLLLFHLALSHLGQRSLNPHFRLDRGISEPDLRYDAHLLPGPRTPVIFWVSNPSAETVSSNGPGARSSKVYCPLSPDDTCIGGDCPSRFSCTLAPLAVYPAMSTTVPLIRPFCGSFSGSVVAEVSSVLIDSSGASRASAPIPLVLMRDDGDSSAACAAMPLDSAHRLSQTSALGTV